MNYFSIKSQHSRHRNEADRNLGTGLGQAYKSGGIKPDITYETFPHHANPLVNIYEASKIEPKLYMNVHSMVLYIIFCFM